MNIWRYKSNDEVPANLIRPLLYITIDQVGQTWGEMEMGIS
jgi:hypothetical protein